MTGGQRATDLPARRSSFGGADEPGAVDADGYDAVRPGWPADTLQWLLGAPSPGVLLDVLELGAGTGKGTRTLAALGHRVVAVEPSRGMRATLERSLQRAPEAVRARVDVRAGTAEDVPLADGSADVVMVLQAWHWFDEAAAARECARVLRPGGVLSMAWHQRDESVPWSRRLSQAVRRDENLPSDSPPPVLPAEFAAVESTLRPYAMRQKVGEVVRHADSWSYVATAPDREQVLQRVREVVTQAAGPDGTVLLRMRTRCYRARRR